MTLPSPEQVGQVETDIIVPNIDRWATRTWPDPSQSEQVTGRDPGFDPRPAQLGQVARDR